MLFFIFNSFSNLAIELPLKCFVSSLFHSWTIEGINDSGKACKMEPQFKIFVFTLPLFYFVSKEIAM